MKAVLGRVASVAAQKFGAEYVETRGQKRARETDEGLFVYSLQGARISNPVSGEFSVVATPAWKVEKGQAVHAVKGAMLSGNVYHLSKNISGLANNERERASWVIAENVKVIGK